MAASDQYSAVEIPWRPGSKLPIRPMSLKDERLLLSDADDRFALAQLAERCVDWDRVEVFTRSRDFGSPEMNYVLAQIRLMTYGDEMILSGIQCPACNHINKNHQVSISRLPLYSTKLPMYITLSKALPDGRDKLRVSKYSIDRQREIAKLIKTHPSDSKSDLTSLQNELVKLSVFPDLELDEARTLAYEGQLSMMDIHKALHLLKSNPYGINPEMTMTCHNKNCKKEGGEVIKFAFDIGGPGLLVPSFNYDGGDTEQAEDV